MTSASVPPARRGCLSVAAVLVGSGFLAWTVAVAVDRNDKDVFPPVLPAALGAGALVLAVVFVHRRRSGLAFAATALGAVLLVATLFTSLYPRVMVSSPDFANSLTVSGAASAHYTLEVISIVVAICLAGHPPLPGLDLSRVPATARRRRARTGPADAGSAGRRVDGLGRIVRALDSQLLARASAARRLLALDVAAGVATALVVLVQAFLLARIVAGAFDGAPLGGAVDRRAPARARLRRPRRARLGIRGRRPPRGPDGALRASARPRRAAPPRPAEVGATAPRRARSSRPRSRGSTASRPTSPGTCRRSCSPASFPWPSSCWWPRSTSARRW